MQVNTLSPCGDANCREMGLSEQKERLQNVLEGVKEAERQAGREPGSVQLIAVSKTFDADQIRPVLEAGHRVFGENRRFAALRPDDGRTRADSNAA